MIKGGPKIINDGLVLCLDAHNAKSYAGEPANNLNSDTNDYTGTSYSNMGEWTSDPTRLSKSYDSTIKTPIGTGATLIQESGTAGYHHLSRMGGSETGNYTISFYFKPVTNDISDLRICMLADGDTYIKFDFTQSTPTVTQGGAALSGKLAMLEALNDGWYFCAGDFNGRSGGWVGCIGYSPQSSYTGTSGNKKAYICGLNYNGLAYAVPSFDRSAVDGWKDRTTNNNDGTLTNMIGTGASHYRDGQVIMPVANSYLEFDGSDDYINISHKSVFDTNIFTIEIWFKSTADDNTHDSLITRNGDVYSSANGWSLGKLRNGLGSTTNALRWIVFGTSTYTDLAGDSTASGNWTQAVGVSDGTNLYLYQNAVQKASGSKPAGNIYPSSYGFKIGANKSSSDIWNGQIAKINFYNKALTAAEVLSNYNATKSRF